MGKKNTRVMQSTVKPLQAWVSSLVAPRVRFQAYQIPPDIPHMSGTASSANNCKREAGGTVNDPRPTTPLPCRQRHGSVRQCWTWRLGSYGTATSPWRTASSSWPLGARVCGGAPAPTGAGATPGRPAPDGVIRCLWRKGEGEASRVRNAVELRPATARRSGRSLFETLIREGRYFKYHPPLYPCGPSI